MRKIAMALAAFLTVGAAVAQDVSFSTVPVNLIDAPVKAWVAVGSDADAKMTTWRAVFGLPRIAEGTTEGLGLVIVSQAHPAGSSWFKGSEFGSRDWVLSGFAASGLRNLRRVESLGHDGRNWGAMAIADLDIANMRIAGQPIADMPVYADLRSATCVVGVVLKKERHSRENREEGGSMNGQVFDCTAGAPYRYDEWKSWFQAFKPIPGHYNSSLDD